MCSAFTEIGLFGYLLVGMGWVLRRNR